MGTKDVAEQVAEVRALIAELTAKCDHLAALLDAEDATAPGSQPAA